MYDDRVKDEDRFCRSVRIELSSGFTPYMKLSMDILNFHLVTIIVCWPSLNLTVAV